MATQAYSFINFNASPTGNNTTNDKPASPGSINFYKSLCEQKGLTLENTTGITINKLNELIAKAKSYFPPSEAQLIKINNLLETLRNGGIQIEVPEDTIKSLTGGRNGTASSLINDLLGMMKAHNITEKTPPSDSQVNFLVSMFLCPDVAFEEYDIIKKIPLEDGLFRMVTPTEFAEQIIEKMTKANASAFIDKYRTPFFTWKNSRAKEGQINYIKTLEERLANTQSVSEIKYALVDGIVTRIQETKHDKSNSWAPQGYTSLSDLQLAQFSVEDASKYIDILKHDLFRKNKIAQEPEIDENRPTLSQEQAIKVEFEKLENLMYTLEAIAGYEDPELHTAINYYINGGKKEYIYSCKEKIREFMLSLFPEHISLEGLINAIADIPEAQFIFVGRF